MSIKIIDYTINIENYYWSTIWKLKILILHNITKFIF